jgi:hypothetical protein
MRKKKVIVYLSVILIVICVLWISRQIIFKSVLNKVINSTEKKLDVKIHYSKTDLLGLRTIYFKDVSVTDKNDSTIFFADSIVTQIKIIPIIFGQVRLKSISFYRSGLKIDDVFVKNLLKKHETNIVATPSKQANYSDITRKIFSAFFDYLPENITLRYTEFKFVIDSISSAISFDNFNLSNDEFAGDIKFLDNKTHSECFVSGTLNPSSNNISVRVFHQGKDLIKLPYIDPKTGASIAFDSLMLSVNFDNKSDSYSELKGYISINNLQIFHKSVSPDTVITQSGYLGYKINIGERYVELDSSSTIKMNRFSFSPYLKVQKDTSLKIKVAFVHESFDADDFFSSLPKGLFTNFNNLQTSGKLAYQMHGSIDFADPDKVEFDSKLENINFAIKKYGDTNFQLLNNPFFHEVYEDDRLVASFIVGPENPNFVSLDEISPFLKYSVLTSEDGDFYYNKGFNEDAFRESIAKNIKEKRFARGGSTITMQLIKNVFLSRKKTISRKMEEALIVWIIENLHLTSKDRMYEVYLNLIEWGPGIYGIKPAAKFYFNKQPKDLTLSESIYLTSLIPRPKGFRYTFDKSGKLRDYLMPYYQLLSGIMVRRNQILPDDTVGLKPIVKLTGEARKMLVISDSTSINDSLYNLQSQDILPIGQ